MINAKLKDIAEVFRGYSPKSTFITKDRDIGRPVFLINYSDINNGKITPKEYTLLKNVNFDNLYKRYRIEKEDIILPTTFTSNLEIKINNETVTSDSKNISLYSQNVIIIRLKKQASFKYEPIVFWNYLNIKRVQEILISKVYSKGKTTKGIMIEKLRELKIPLPADKLYPLIKEYYEEICTLACIHRRKEDTENRICNIIEKDILS